VKPASAGAIQLLALTSTAGTRSCTTRRSLVITLSGGQLVQTFSTRRISDSNIKHRVGVWNLNKYFGPITTEPVAVLLVPRDRVPVDGAEWS
jgi:hypothetical protein